MKMSEWGDKWLVFVLVFGLGVYEGVRDIEFPIWLEFVVVPLMIATTFLLAFVLWRTLCRLIARMFFVNSSSRRVRLISNGVFFSALALVILQPLIFPNLIHRTVTIELPRKPSVN
jgi:hypothetical protein